jgi:hypothetical protein
LEEYVFLLWILAAVSLATALAIGGPFIYLAVAAAAAAMWLRFRSGG